MNENYYCKLYSRASANSSFIGTWEVITIRHHGSQGFPHRSSNHEEVATPEADPAVRCLHSRGAYLHHHGVDEEREPAGVPAGEGPHYEAHPADRHVRPGGCRDGLP